MLFSQIRPIGIRHGKVMITLKRGTVLIGSTTQWQSPPGWLQKPFYRYGIPTCTRICPKISGFPLKSYSPKRDSDHQSYKFWKAAWTSRVFFWINEPPVTDMLIRTAGVMRHYIANPNNALIIKGKSLKNYHRFELRVEMFTQIMVAFNDCILKKSLGKIRKSIPLSTASW